MQPVWLTDTVTGHLARSVRFTLLWGLEGVVLRTVEGARVPDVNEAKLRGRLSEAGLEIAAVDPGVFEGSPDQRAVWMNDLERLEETAAFSSRTGCTRILVGALPGGAVEAAADVLARAAERARRYRVELCLRNEGEGRASAEAIGKLLESAGSEGLSTAWDPAAALEADSGGESQLPEGPIGLVMVRNVVRRGQRFVTARLTDGDLDWGSILRVLAGGSFAGPLCLDFRDASPKDALRDATELIRLIRMATGAS